MDSLPPPPTFFLLLFSGWINRHQQAVIDYLLEENRVLRAVNGSRRLRRAVFADILRFRARVLVTSGGKSIDGKSGAAPEQTALSATQVTGQRCSARAIPQTHEPQRFSTHCYPSVTPLGSEGPELGRIR